VIGISTSTSHRSEARHYSVKQHVHAFTATQPMCAHAFNNRQKAATSTLLSSLFALQHRELSLFNPSGILPASCLVTPHYTTTPYTITQDNSCQRDFYTDLDDSYRLCPMLNGTWKPEDRPDGQGDSSFGAVPAALTL
jgi:hypothetical protein